MVTRRTLALIALAPLLLIFLLLAGCGGGGGGSSTIPQASPQVAWPPVLRAMLHASDRVATDPGYVLHIQPRTEANVEVNVREQSKLPGEVILWAGFTKGEGFGKFPEYLAQAAHYPNIRYAYIYDEKDWDGARYVPGLHREQIHLAADQARAAGLQPVITIMPDIILQSDFALDVKRFSVIGVDPYPSVRPAGLAPLETCGIKDNEMSRLFGCSAAKLRRMGFEGKIFYVYQSFGRHDESEATLLSGLKLQRETIDNARALGADGVMPYGLYLGAAELAAEPYLFPLHGTPYEALVTP